MERRKEGNTKTTSVILSSCAKQEEGDKRMKRKQTVTTPKETVLHFSTTNYKTSSRKFPLMMAKNCNKQDLGEHIHTHIYPRVESRRTKSLV